MTNNRYIVALVLTLVAMTLPAQERGLRWQLGLDAGGARVAGSTQYLRGMNYKEARIDANINGALKLGFSFDPQSRPGSLYRGAYQGLGVGVNNFQASGLLGNPVSVYAFQGAPVARFSSRSWLSYEWQFGAAMGWKHIYNEEDYLPNMAVSTRVTAHMGISLKYNYALTKNWLLSAGLQANHYSNGNTRIPNGGINSFGGNIGLTYLFDPAEWQSPAPDIEADADRKEWMLDVMGYGAWRRRIVFIDTEGTLCTGKFGVAGLDLTALRKFNRWFTAGVATEFQFDESAGLAPYWVEGTYDKDIKFARPPFGKQLSAGLSGHAELTMPIFTLDVGIGYDLLKPRGDSRFYQSLTLKTFLTRHLYLNVGYRLAEFSDPQNLKLGIGWRFGL